MSAYAFICNCVYFCVSLSVFADNISLDCFIAYRGGGGDQQLNDSKLSLLAANYGINRLNVRVSYLLIRLDMRVSYMLTRLHVMYMVAIH